jgi:hypothetical protein
MQFFIEWRDDFTQDIPKRFETLTHTDVLALEIIEEEGKIPEARLTIPLSQNTEEFSPVGRIFMHSDTTKTPTLLFQGRLRMIMEKREDHQISFSLVARSKTTESNEVKIRKELEGTPYIDPLFDDTAFEPFLEERVAHTPWVLHYDRNGENVRLVDPFWGIKIHSMPPNTIFRDFSITKKALPIGKAVVKICAQWIQQASGIVNIAPEITRHFEGGYLTTLTGRDFESKFWREGPLLGQTGYTLLKSTLDPVNPPLTPGHQRYPTSVRVSFKENTDTYIKQHWYKCQLLLHWHYRQKREEYLHFALHANLQGDERLDCATQEIFFKLGSLTTDFEAPLWESSLKYLAGDRVCCEGKIYEAVQEHTSTLIFQDDVSNWKIYTGVKIGISDASVSSFFLTDRGKYALNHALLRVRSYLKKASRVMEMSITGDLLALSHLSCADSIAFEDPEHKGKILQGKITYFHLVADARNEIYEVRLKVLCAIGKESSSSSSNLENPTDFLKYGSFDDQKPRWGLSNPKTLTANDFVKGMQIENPVSEQKKLILAKPLKNKSELEELLSKNPTRMRIFLQEMRARDVLIHNLYVPWVESITPPAQIS